MVGSIAKNKSFFTALLTVMMAFSGWLNPSLVQAAIGAVWANEGGDKVVRHELRATANAEAVRNRVWDGTRIRLFGGRNEVVNFNLVLEAPNGASQIRVLLNTLNGPNGSRIASIAAAGDDVFNYLNRNIELFYVRYLQIKGLSRVSYETYDERHVPLHLRRPSNGDGMGSGTWQDRPNHLAYYPDIAVPLELVPPFDIPAGHNQSIWGDIYIPRTAPAGNYTGTVILQEGGVTTRQIPIELTVRNFTLPDTFSAKTQLFFSSSNIKRRYLGTATPAANSAAGLRARQIRDRHFLIAHRHRISLIGDTPDDCDLSADRPCPEWLPRLNGSLFTSSQGYDGPGAAIGNDVYSIGTYGVWNWQSGGQTAMNLHTNAWATWFNENSPNTEYFLYLADESSNFSSIETWSRWILNNSGVGRQVRSMTTTPLPAAASQAPSLDIPASTLIAGPIQPWDSLADRYTHDARKRFYMYNGHRPATGSFATEDDGVALRQLAWAQFKKHISRWFFWESTYYNNFQGGTGEVNLFQTAQTFGSHTSDDPVLGQTGWNYSNGDGVLFYPGTDQLFPSDSYGVNGPFASLRLKAWRRGLQDVEYLTLASMLNPEAVQTLMNTLVPKVLWEYGTNDPRDPSWVRTDISWSTDPEVWEAARAHLADILDGHDSANVSLPSRPVFINLQSNYPMTGNLQAISNYASLIRFTFNSPTLAAPRELRSGSMVPSDFAAASISGALSFSSVPGLVPGRYRVTATAENAMGVSPSTEVDIFIAPGIDTPAHVYPNPWRSDRHPGTFITFDQLSLNSTIKIFTLSGGWVKTLQAPDGRATWDLTNDGGRHVASGLYLYLITHEGRNSRGKIVIIR